MFNFERSMALRKRLGKHCRAGLCYRSAVRGLRYGLKSLQDAVYVEGYAVSSFATGCDVIYHGWLELPDGTVIDPTALACFKAFCGALGGSFDAESWKYFQAWRYSPAMRYTREDLRGRRLNSLPMQWDDDMRTEISPYKEAYRQAIQIQHQLRQEANAEFERECQSICRGGGCI